MSPNFPAHSGTREEAEARAALVEELELRIEAIEGLDDSEIGSFTLWDWLACVVGAVILPAIAMWWFA